MDLHEEVEEIVKNRPTRAERKEYRADAREIKYKRKREGGGVFPKKIPYAVLVLLMGLAAAVLMAAMIVVDVFPQDLTVIIIAVIVALLVVTSLLLARKRRWKRVLGLLICMVFIAAVGALSYYMWTSYAMLNRISETGSFSNAENHASAVDPTEQAFNIYVTGIDQWESEKGLDLERSDVNMIVTINPKTKKILLTSIPRDTYVKLHTAQQMDKLTHTGVYGVDETLDTVEDWLGVDLDYYVKMNFTGARDVINAMGGIDVYSPVTFKSSLKGYTYEKGWNHLNGKRALFFARERHAFEGQDSIRVENQQRVMKAMIKKMTSSKTLLTRYGDIMAAAGDNLHTDMSYDEISDLVKMQMTDLAEWEVETQKIEGEYDMDYVASLTQRQKFSVYRPDEKSVRSCIEGIDGIMNPTVAELEAAEESRKKGFVVNIIDRIRNRNEVEEDVDPIV